MKKYALGVVAALVAALVVLMPGQGAHAAQDPYQDAICSIALSTSQVVSGESFTVTVTADRPVDLSVTFQGETRSRANAQELTATFRAPNVDRPQTLQVTASCDGNPRAVGIEILPAGISDGGVPGQGGSDLAGSGSGAGESALGALLPRTGGAPFWLLLLGIALALAGGAVVVRRRRA